MDRGLGSALRGRRSCRRSIGRFGTLRRGGGPGGGCGLDDDDDDYENSLGESEDRGRLLNFMMTLTSDEWHFL
jgi:hypothetical protein